MPASIDLVIGEFVVLSAICCLLMRFYRGSMVSFDVVITVYLSWVLGFAGVLLLPYDLSVAIVDISVYNSRLDRVWETVYWSTFILAWGILPIQILYHSSGHFSFLDKLIESIKKHLYQGAAAAFVALVYVMYMAAVGGGSVDEIVGFMMAMSNTYGVLIIIILMGSGFVSLPRRLWQMVDNKRELQRLYLKACSVEESFQEARYELEDCEIDVQKLAELAASGGRNSSQDDSNHARYLMILQKKVTDFVFSHRSTSRRHKTSREPSASNSSNQISERSSSSKHVFVDLHARLIRAQQKARACETRWRGIINQIMRTEELGKYRASLQRADEEDSWNGMPTSSDVDEGKAMATSQVLQYRSRMKQTAKSIVILRIYAFGLKALSVVCALLSCVILWAELTMSTSLKSPIGFIIGAYKRSYTESDSVISQGVAFIVLLYMSVCMYWAFSRIDFGWAFALQGPHQSSPSSLIISGEYLSRLQFPLGFNFLMTLNAASTKFTSFNTLMQNMQLIPVFGTSFAVYLPVVMVLVSIGTLFDIFPRFLKWCGVESDDPVGNGSVFAGVTSAIRSCRMCFCHSSSDAAADSSSLLLDEEEAERYERGRKVVQTEVKHVLQQVSNDSSSLTLSSANTLALQSSSSMLVSVASGKAAAQVLGRSKPPGIKFNSLRSTVQEVCGDEEKGGGSKPMATRSHHTMSTATFITQIPGRKAAVQVADDCDDDEEINFDFRKYIAGGDENVSAGPIEEYSSASRPKTLSTPTILFSASTKTPIKNNALNFDIHEDEDDDMYRGRYG